MLERVEQNLVKGNKNFERETNANFSAIVTLKSAKKIKCRHQHSNCYHIFQPLFVSSQLHFAVDFLGTIADGVVLGVINIKDHCH